jgi:hypothetical protein
MAVQAGQKFLPVFDVLRTVPALLQIIQDVIMTGEALLGLEEVRQLFVHIAGVGVEGEVFYVFVAILAGNLTVGRDVKLTRMGVFIIIARKDRIRLVPVCSESGFKSIILGGDPWHASMGTYRICVGPVNIGEACWSVKKETPNDRSWGRRSPTLLPPSLTFDRGGRFGVNGTERI